MLAAKTLLQQEKTKLFRTNDEFHKKSSHVFLYIGNDKTIVNSLFHFFYNGLVVENFKEIKSIFSLKKEKKIPDVMIVDDRNLQDINFRNFIVSLKSDPAFDLPVIYLTKQSPNRTTAIELAGIVDDIVDMDNLQFDISRKINFLREAKKYRPILFRKKDDAAITYSSTNLFLKRLIDIILSSLLIILLLPAFILIALAIKIESKGPIFYNSKRAGRGFKIFNFYKFRTMEVNADKQVASLAHLNQYDNGNAPKFFKITNDPRVTKVGKFLRNTSLDELPQLFNVFKGDMSLVGNRPLPLYEAATLTTNESIERFMAPAGMTGLWQIKKRGKANMSCEERINLDITYARKSNVFFDLWILAKTPKALFQKTNV